MMGRSFEVLGALMGEVRGDLLLTGGASRPLPSRKGFTGWRKLRGFVVAEDYEETGAVGDDI